MYHDLENILDMEEQEVGVDIEDQEEMEVLERLVDQEALVAMAVVAEEEDQGRMENMDLVKVLVEAEVAEDIEEDMAMVEMEEPEGFTIM